MNSFATSLSYEPNLLKNIVSSPAWRIVKGEDHTNNNIRSEASLLVDTGKLIMSLGFSSNFPTVLQLDCCIRVHLSKSELSTAYFDPHHSFRHLHLCQCIKKITWTLITQREIQRDLKNVKQEQQQLLLCISCWLFSHWLIIPFI